MICDICHQNEATIHIQEIIENQKKTVNICQGCAAKKASAENILDGLNLAKFFYNISSQTAPTKKDGKDNELFNSLPTCDKCGWNGAKFSETGRLGCAECYNTFKKVLIPALKNMHKGSMHVGKKPSSSSYEANKENGAVLLRIMELQKQLEEYILREEFEKAAGLRDKINNLKKKNKKTENKKDERPD